LTDLRESHTQKMHLMLIDTSLSDYHHEHPRATATPGEFAFEFTPRKTGPYRAWADLRPVATGFYESPTADLPAGTAGDPLTDKLIRLDAQGEGLRAELSFSSPEIHAGQPVPGKLRITRTDGTPVTQLQPLMAAFAHFAGFHEDGQSVLHLHPQGMPVTQADARAGPELQFTFYCHKAGFVRLFAQVQVDGESKCFPFGLKVVSEKAAAD
jgi:hypothetical protein